MRFTSRLHDWKAFPARKPYSRDCFRFIRAILKPGSGNMGNFALVSLGTEKIQQSYPSYSAT
jgi:hypothetical protein